MGLTFKDAVVIVGGKKITPTNKYIYLLGLFFVVKTFAAEGLSTSPTTKIKTNEATTIKSGDLDAEIKDSKLRASSGAKSKYSTTLFFHYQGASLNKPLDDKRPNVGDSRMTEPVYTSGDIFLRYRKNKNESYYFATGYYRQRPFRTREANEKLSVDDPSFGYNHTFSSNDLQIGSGFRINMATASYERAYRQVGTLGYSLNALSPLGTSRFNAGIGLKLWASVYDSNDENLMPWQNDYGIALTPLFQYNKTGRVSVYTSLDLFNYSHYRPDNAFKFDSGKMTQSLGMGFAVVRDFYLAPNLTFEPEHLSSKMTAVNLNAYMNL